MFLRIALLVILGGLVLACTGTPTQKTVQQYPRPYFGATTLEERIATSSVIARVRLESVESGVMKAHMSESAPATFFYVGRLNFNFRVLEYLKGSGVLKITGVVMVRRHAAQTTGFDPSRQEMADALPDIIDNRDTRWDEREAVVFLKEDHDYSGGGGEGHKFLPYVRNNANHYYMGEYAVNQPGDDAYTVSSIWDKLWLPASSSTSTQPGPGRSTDQRTFLLDAPRPGRQSSAATRSTSSPASSPTITLSALKGKITNVKTRLAASTADHHEDCVKKTYARERAQAATGWDLQGSYRIELRDIASGQPAGTKIWSDDKGHAFGIWTSKLWLNEAGEALLDVETGDVPAWHLDRDDDGTDDSAFFERRLHLARPLPAGEHSFEVKSRGSFYAVCEGYVHQYPMGTPRSASLWALTWSRSSTPRPTATP